MSEGIGETIRATALMYAACAAAATRVFIRNWIIVPGSIAAFLIFSVCMQLFLPLGMAGGFVVGLVEVALLTLYYRWIADSTEGDRLRFSDLIQFDYSLFVSIISVGFVVFIAKYIISSLILGMSLGWINALISLVIIIVLNPVAETIMHHRFEGMTAISHAYRFVLDNWVEWFLPFVLIMIPWMLIDRSDPLLMLARTDPLLPGSPVIFAAVALGYWVPLPGLVLAAIGVVVVNWFMIFRLNLFRDLDSSSRRQRSYRYR